MASAGRILIMPKGNYDSSITYEMLDLVFHSGASWVAKKNVTGIEPSDANAEHWMKMCESVDLTEVIMRIAALESQMLGTISLDDIDLSGYATKSELTNYLKLTGGILSGKLGFGNDKGVIAANDYGAFIQAKKDSTNYRHIKIENPSQPTEASDWAKIIDVENDEYKEYKLFGEHNTALLMNLLSTSISGVKFYTGNLGDNGADRTRRIPCPFPPKLVIVIGQTEYSSLRKTDTSTTILIPDIGWGNTTFDGSSISMGALDVTKDGNDVIIDYKNDDSMLPTYACYNAIMSYKYICIG